MRRQRRVAGKEVRLECNVMGIDPSLNSTGYSRKVGGVIETGMIKPLNKRGPDRLYYVRSALRRLLRENKPDLVVYEGYSMGSRGNNTFNIGEMGGTLLLELWEQGIDVLLVPPKTLKLAIAGSGNADKDQVKRAVLDLFGQNIQADDEADAFALMVFGEVFLRGIGPSAFVARAKKQISKTELVKGRRLVDCNRLQKTSCEG